MAAAAKAWSEIKVWRRATREDLVARRVAMTPAEHRDASAAIHAHLTQAFALPADAVLAFCWPFKHEFDVRFAVRAWREHGTTAALPVVAGKAQALQFRQWWPGAPMRKGVYDIPYPDGTDLLAPDVAFVPMNGFDEQGYRLGYGGGYFDRTLAALSQRPVAVGIAFEFARLPTIFPQPHDIAMDFVVTEAGVHAVIDGRLEKSTAADCSARFRALLSRRGLPRRTAAPSQGYSSPACYAAEFSGYFGEDAPGAKGAD